MDLTNFLLAVVKEVLLEEMVGVVSNVDALVLELLVLMMPPEAVKVISLASGIEHDQLLVLPQVTRSVRSLLIFISPVQVEDLDDSILLFPFPAGRAMLNVYCLAILPENLKAELLIVKIFRERHNLGLFAHFLQVCAHCKDIVAGRDPFKNLEV